LREREKNMLFFRTEGLREEDDEQDGGVGEEPPHGAVSQGPGHAQTGNNKIIVIYSPTTITYCTFTSSA
jgi:hypothetical protein